MRRDQRESGSMFYLDMFYPEMFYLEMFYLDLEVCLILRWVQISEFLWVEIKYFYPDVASVTGWGWWG